MKVQGGCKEGASKGLAEYEELHSFHKFRNPSVTASPPECATARYRTRKLRAHHVVGASSLHLCKEDARIARVLGTLYVLIASSSEDARDRARAHLFIMSA